MVETTDLIHMMDPSGAPQNVNFDEPVSTFDTRYHLTKTITVSAVGPTDNLDVAGVGAVFIDCSADDVTIGGFINGINGQVLHIARLCASAHTAKLEHNEGTGNQDILLHAGADEALTTEYGGWMLVCNGTNWFDVSHSKHV